VLEQQTVYGFVIRVDLTLWLDPDIDVGLLVSNVGSQGHFKQSRKFSLTTDLNLQTLPRCTTLCSTVHLVYGHSLLATIHNTTLLVQISTPSLQNLAISLVSFTNVFNKAASHPLNLTLVQTNVWNAAKKGGQCVTVWYYNSLLVITPLINTARPKPNVVDSNMELEE
jgi:hypothetical protein